LKIFTEMCIEIFLSKICRIYREKEMTLPKGYKPNTPSRDDDDNRPTSSSRPRKNKNWARIMLSLILFLISLSATIYFIIQVIETGKAVDEQKKVVEKSKFAYEEAFKDVYGRYPSPSEYPN
jgi:hypothetical protein